LVEPEVVATSPCRIKSPMPVCCGFSSITLRLIPNLPLKFESKLGTRGRIRACTGDALDVVPLLIGLREQANWSG